MITFKERVGWATYYMLPKPAKETPTIILPSTQFEANIKVEAKTDKPSTVTLKLIFMSGKTETQISIDKKIEKPETINVNVRANKNGLIVEHDNHVDIVFGKWEKLKAIASATEGDAAICGCTISCFDPAMALIDSIYNMQQAMIMMMYVNALITMTKHF